MGSLGFARFQLPSPHCLTRQINGRPYDTITPGGSPIYLQHARSKN